MPRIYNLGDDLVKPGTPLDDILGAPVRHGMHSSNFDTRDEYIGWRHEVIARGQHDKTIRRIRQPHHHDAAPSDEGWRFVSTHEDITEQRQQEARIQHLARHDALTELPNWVPLHGGVARPAWLASELVSGLWELSANSTTSTPRAGALPRQPGARVCSMLGAPSAIESDAFAGQGRT